MGSKQSIGSVIRGRWLVRLKTNFPTTKYSILFQLWNKTKFHFFKNGRWIWNRWMRMAAVPFNHGSSQCDRTEVFQFIKKTWLLLPFFNTEIWFHSIWYMGEIIYRSITKLEPSHRLVPLYKKVVTRSKWELEILLVWRERA